jgi:RHS repeat-associated protein
MKGIINFTRAFKAQVTGQRARNDASFHQIGLIRTVAKQVKRLSIGVCALVSFSMGYSGQPPNSSASPPSATPAQVNRTVPKVEPPKTVLEFSTSPTVDEFFRARVFAEPLVPIGGKPTIDDNADLAAALLGYAKRTGPDDFSSLTGYLENHPNSPWAAALLTGLGLEYYNTAHYSLAIDAWGKSWILGKDATDAKGMANADRAVGELAYMYARLGRMSELESLLKSLQGRVLVGPATEKIAGAGEGLWTMKNHPEIAFRCGPLALERIKRRVDPQHPAADIIRNSASTEKGCSLPQVAELSQKIGLNYQMAFRQAGGEFVIPSVVHWKVGHYAALVRKEGGMYLLEDPTFGNRVWATRQALEDETSGYFLIAPGTLPSRWRTVNAKEGGLVWGKGTTTGNDPGPITPRDPSTGFGTCKGMMVSAVHLMDVNLRLMDEPVGYTPPVGPPVRFTVRYNSRDAFQPANFTYGNLGSQWTFDWFAYITDNPMNPLADVNYYVQGGGDRTFTDFDTNTQAFAYQQYDQTLLTRTSTNTYQMLWPDGSKLIFGQPDGSVGTTRNIFLTKIIDPQGNAVTFTYDTNFLLVAVTDAIGQVTTLAYGLPEAFEPEDIPADEYKLTKVTDPFGRSARFDYVPFVYESIISPSPDSLPTYLYEWVLGGITDEIGLTSQVISSPILVEQAVVTNNFLVSIFSPSVSSLVTPYGTNIFLQGGSGTTRFLETTYPDGSRDRVEFNQTNLIPDTDPQPTVPQGMGVLNEYLNARNTYYWSRTACSSAYGDYSKAKVYHWLHAEDINTCSSILESTKGALENRVWYDYAGQSGGAYQVGNNNLPTHVGRVLDDGSTQLYTQAYNPFGHLTNSIDPVGRTFSYIYDTNGIDLLEIHQTRAGNNELLFRAAYNSQHRPLTITDAAGETNTFSYNARGQLLTATDPKNETTTFAYDTNAYLIAMDGPLPGTNDIVTATYDTYGRIRTETDVSGYMLTFDYDNLDRITRVTFPDATFLQNTYDRLDRTAVQDRAGRQTYFEYNNMRQTTKMTDPLGRVTLTEWCRCGGIKNLIDPIGRTTSWVTDVQGRRIAKLYGDGSQVKYLYENTTSRVRQIIDEKLQTTTFNYNLDNSLSSIGYADTTVPTPGVAYTYDPKYARIVSRSDGTGKTLYSYIPVAASPTLGAGRLASIEGPLVNDTITYGYDELGRLNHTSINGVDSAISYDVAGRVVGASNALGSFAYAYDKSSDRLVSQSFPNGQTEERSYGGNLQDFTLQQLSYVAGATPISQFVYGRDIPADQITSWSQQAGAQSPSIFNFSYDAADQLLSATVTNAGTLLNTFAYGYDPAGNRLAEQIGATVNTSTYNALNQLSTSTTSGASRTNEWDAANRLVAVDAGNQRTEFTYDGQSRVVGIRQLMNGAEVSHRLLVWNGSRISEEHDTNGAVTKRFFAQGVQLTMGTNAGIFYYTRDHLGSVRELTDAGGNIRARYSYDPFGRRTKVNGDMDADFGFAGMFWSSEASLAFTHFRVYDPELGRWLSRDPLRNAEMEQGPNLYAYVRNEPVNGTDREGLAGSIPGWGLNTVTTTLIALEVSDPDALPGFVEDLGLGAQNVAQHGTEIAQDCQTGATELMETVVPAVENVLGTADTVVADTIVADTVAPQAVQTIDSIAPEASSIAQTEIPTDTEWANTWMTAMLNLREDYMGDYNYEDVLALREEYNALYERYLMIKQLLGVPGFD